MKAWGLSAALVSVLASGAVAGEISGRQYLVTDGGPSPIADNAIHIIPCTSPLEVAGKPLDCMTIENDSKYFRKVLNASSDLIQGAFYDLTSKYGTHSGVEYVDSYKAWNTFVDIDREITPFLSRQPGYKIARTDYEGKFSFDCPAKTCLIYSAGKADSTFGYWMQYAKSGSRLDLTKSNGNVEKMP